MYIGILTQPLAANYGCNLQAYALKTVLERMGCEVEFLDRWPVQDLKSKSSFQRMVRLFKDVIKFVIGKPIYHAIELKDQPYYWQNFIQFQKQYFQLSPKLYSTEDIKEYSKHRGYDAFVVGSDQVWRPAYNLGDKLNNMFLDFTEGEDVKRISYAASFGVDDWEYSEEQTRTCRKLVAEFDAISVREKTGVDLCHNKLGVDAVHVLDPTLLLKVEDYVKLIANAQVKQSDGSLFCYILDSSSPIKSIINKIEVKTGYKAYTCLPLIPESTYNPFHKEACILPSIEQWLKCFMDAELVFVDSFHGMVFSIIYNKPFWVIGNSKRGLSRFTSLLHLLGLENRLITMEELNKIDLNIPIDWQPINRDIASYRTKSLTYLENALKQ